MRQYIDKEEAQERSKALCDKFHLAYDEFSEDPNTMSYQFAHIFDNMKTVPIPEDADIQKAIADAQNRVNSLRDNIYPMSSLEKIYISSLRGHDELWRHSAQQ